MVWKGDPLEIESLQCWRTRQIEPQHNKTNKMKCAPSKDTNQPTQPRLLNSLLCLHEEALGPWLSMEHTAKTLIRLGRCPGWSESLLGTHHFVCFVMLWLIYNFKQYSVLCLFDYGLNCFEFHCFCRIQANRLVQFTVFLMMFGAIIAGS